MVLSSEIIGVIVGGALVTVSGILIHYVTKHLDEKRTKRHVSRAIRSEVEINQALLESLIASIEFLKNANVDVYSETLRPVVGSGKCITFERTLYPSLSDKIGLLSSEIIELVAKYYGKLHYIEAVLSLVKMSEPQTIKILYGAKDAYKIGENLRKRLK